MSNEEQPPYKFNIVRVMRWTAFNAFHGALMWFAYMQHHQWAANVFAFITCLQAVMSLMMFSDSARESLSMKGPSVPIGLNLMADLLYAMACAAVGNFWLASAWAWIAVAGTAFYSKPSSKSKSEPSP